MVATPLNRPVIRRVVLKPKYNFVWLAKDWESVPVPGSFPVLFKGVALILYTGILIPVNLFFEPTLRPRYPKAAITTRRALRS